MLPCSRRKEGGQCRIRTRSLLKTPRALTVRRAYLVFGVSHPGLELGRYLDCTCYCNALTMQTALLHPYPHPHPLHLDACRPPQHSPDRKSDLLQSPESRFLILPLIYLPSQICSESAGTGDIHVQSTFSASFPQIRSIVHSATPTSTHQHPNPSPQPPGTPTFAG